MITGDGVKKDSIKLADTKFPHEFNEKVKNIINTNFIYKLDLPIFVY